MLFARRPQSFRLGCVLGCLFSTLCAAGESWRQDGRRPNLSGKIGHSEPHEDEGREEKKTFPLDDHASLRVRTSASIFHSLLPPPFDFLTTDKKLLAAPGNFLDSHTTRWRWDRRTRANQARQAPKYSKDSCEAFGPMAVCGGRRKSQSAHEISQQGQARTMEHGGGTRWPAGRRKPERGICQRQNRPPLPLGTIIAPSPGC